VYQFHALGLRADSPLIAQLNQVYELYQHRCPSIAQTRDTRPPRESSTVFQYSVSISVATYGYKHIISCDSYAYDHSTRTDPYNIPTRLQQRQQCSLCPRLTSSIYAYHPSVCLLAPRPSDENHVREGLLVDSMAVRRLASFDNANDASSSSCIQGRRDD